MDESAARPGDDPVESVWQWVSVTQAHALTGLSAPTIRRRVKDGQAVRLPNGEELVLQGELRQRPQGTVFSIRLPAALGAPPTDDAPDASEPDVSNVPNPAEPTGELAPWLDALLSRTGASYLEPVLAQLRDAQQRSVDQAETIGLQRARLERALADLDERTRQLEQARAHQAMLEAAGNETTAALKATHARLVSALLELEQLKADASTGPETDITDPSQSPDPAQSGPEAGPDPARPWWQRWREWF